MPATARPEEAAAVDDTDYVAMDALLEGWAKWASGERGPLRAAAAGVVLQIASVREGEYTVRMTDDQFTLLDSRVAILITRLREIVDLEYRSLWRGRYYHLTQEAKWRRLGIGRTSYGKRLAQMQRSLFHSLKPEILEWIGRRAAGA